MNSGKLIWRISLNTQWNVDVKTCSNNKFSCKIAHAALLQNTEKGNTPMPMIHFNASLQFGEGPSGHSNRMITNQSNSC